MTHRLIALRLLVLLLLLHAGPSLAWWHCDWRFRIPVTISQPPGAAVTDYQVRIALNASNVPAHFDWSLQGSDLRLVDQDDLSQLDLFIEQWNVAARTAVIWVRVPTIAAGGRTIYLYFAAPAGTPSASTPMTFTESGLKVHTRNSTVNPSSRATAEAAFNAASDGVPGYGCRIINSYTNVNNVGLFSPPARNGDFGWFAEVFFEVSPAQAGVWQFRYGADFGRGGGLYVDDIALDEKWNTDLWWNFNWNNTTQILQGSINLAPGTHSFRILGFEGCCDGGLTAEFRRPGSATWLAMAQSNISLRSRKCPTYVPTVSFGAATAAACPRLVISRTTQTLSDPVNGLLNPKVIPGATVLNTSRIRNSGTGPVNANTVVISEPIASDMALRVSNFDGVTAGPVQFLDGSPASGLTYTFTALNDLGDDVAFSNDYGASFSYTPVADANGTDVAVTNIRINPKNALRGNTGSGDPAASFSFKAVVK